MLPQCRRELADLRSLVDNMEIEMRTLSQAERARFSTRVDSYRAIVNRLDSELVRLVCALLRSRC